MNVIMALCFTAIFIVVIRKHRFFKDSGLSFQILIGIFSLKLLSAIALHLLYSIYYTERSEADIFKYFDDGIQIRSDVNFQKNIDGWFCIQTWD